MQQLTETLKWRAVSVKRVQPESIILSFYSLTLIRNIYDFLYSTKTQHFGPHWFVDRSPGTLWQCRSPVSSGLSEYVKSWLVRARCLALRFLVKGK